MPDKSPIHYAFHYSHYSQALKEQRHYSVYLPDDYEHSPDQYYPVLYLLDGEKYLLQAAGLVSSSQNGLSPTMPDMIIVAIHNVDRNRDYTPTHTVLLPDGITTTPLFETTGGARTFIEYLQKELQPKIEQDYRTSNPNVIVGHSFGGLLVLENLADENSTFQGYICIDPSLWFDYPNNVQRIEALLLNATLDTQRSLFFAIANTAYTPGIGLSSLHKNLLHQLESKMQETPSLPFHLSSQFYSHHDHHAVFIPALTDGLQSIFHGYQINISSKEFSINNVIQSMNLLNERLDSNLTPNLNKLEIIKAKAEKWPNMKINPDDISTLINHYRKKVE